MWHDRNWAGDLIAQIAVHVAGVARLAARPDRPSLVPFVAEKVRQDCGCAVCDSRRRALWPGTCLVVHEGESREVREMGPGVNYQR
jgi:hypothetical protein